MKQTLLFTLFISLLLINFVSSETCSVQIDEYEQRVENLEAKIDKLETYYNMLPTISQTVNRIETKVQDISDNDSNFKIFLVPGTIVVCFIIVLVIILARRKDG